MREVKFRAYDTQSEIFVESEDFYISSDGKVTVKDDYDDSVWNEGGPIELMQFTGLLDKEGNEIYEGDIVDCRMNFDNSHLPHMGEIVYLDIFGAFATKNLAGETLLHNHLLNTFEIIGNIYENPELIEGLK